MTVSQTKQKFTKKELQVLLLLTAVQFVVMVDFVVIMPLGPTLIRELDMDPSKFGSIVSIYVICSGIIGFLGAQVLDFMDRKTAISFFFCGLILGTMGCGLAQSANTLFWARGLTGAFGGLLSASSIAFASDYIAKDRIGMALGVLFSSFSIASIVGVPLGLEIASRTDWHSPFLALVLVGIAIYAACMRYLPSMRGHLVLGRKIRSPFSIVIEYFFSRKAYGLAVAFLVMFSTFLIIPFIPLYFTRNYGFMDHKYSVAYFIGGICTLTTVQLVGRLSDRYYKPKVFAFIATLSMIHLYIITHFGSDDVLWVSLLLAGFMALMSGRGIPAMAMITGSVEPKQRGSFMSLNQTIQNLGSGLGAYVGGLTSHISNQGTLVGFHYNGYLAISSTALAIVLINKIPKAHTQPPVHGRETES